MAPRERRAEHRHAQATVTTVLSGAYAEEFGTVGHVVERACLQLKPAGAPHTTEADAAGGDLLVLLFEDAFLLGQGLAPDHVPLALLHPGIATARLLALRDSAHLRVEMGSRIRAFLSSLLPPSLPRGREQEAVGWLPPLLERIATRPDPRPSLEALSREAGVHPMHMTRVFRQRQGCSIGEFHRRARVEAAVGLLLAQPISLADLALSLGYCDQSHFTREFVRLTGIPPARLLRAFPTN